MQWLVIQPVAPRKAEPGAPCLVVKAFSTARLLGVRRCWFRKLSAPPPAANYSPSPQPLLPVFTLTHRCVLLETRLRSRGERKWQGDILCLVAGPRGTPLLVWNLSQAWQEV